MQQKPDRSSWWGDVDIDDDPNEPSTLIIADVPAILAELAAMTPAELDAEFGSLWNW